MSGTAGTPQPEHAWKALTITNEWVRHADSKTGVTLAFIGATATVLFNLVNGHKDWTWALIVVTGLAVVAIIAAIICAALALLPRLQRYEHKGDAAATTVGLDESVNLLFFGDVHRRYRDDRPTYSEVLSLLTSDPVGLTGQIADQIHANAHIASVKFRYANRAIVCELVAVATIAGVALLRTTGW